MIASAASKALSGKGRVAAVACTRVVPWCWANITAEGSTAITEAEAGSYAPAPAPTFTTVRALRGASPIKVASQGSGLRPWPYPMPMWS